MIPVTNAIPKSSSTSTSNVPLSLDLDEAETLSDPRRLVDHFFRYEYAKLVATLTRRFGVRNWELVEDVVQSSLERALRSWSLSGIPPNPSGWLHRVASNLAIDALRRDRRWNALDSSHELPIDGRPPSDLADDSQVQDDLLRMIYVCCNPDVTAESQIALALKTLCGFGNAEIAKALLTTEASVAKRITRAKRRLRSQHAGMDELNPTAMKQRLPDVQSVIYLLFNEGYSSTIVDKPIREELCEEAVRLALMLAEHPSTNGPEAAAFLSLLLYHAARLDARIDQGGTLLLLKEQDRSLWNQDLLQVASYWFEQAAVGENLTRYHAEAWIASEHCRASCLEDTNWQHIATAYDLLCVLAPSPVHQLNRAIAIGRRDGPQAGLDAFSSIDQNAFSVDYYLWHAARGELCRQTGDLDTARISLQTAWKLAPTNSEKELISRKLDAL